MSHSSELVGNGDGFSPTLILAGLAGASGVAIGAFGAHYLAPVLEMQYDSAGLVAKRMAQFDTGARYHLLHAVALLGLATLEKNLASHASSPRLLSLAALLMVAGILLFSGSLYVLVLSGQTWLGAITPLGGLSWIIAWSLVAVSGWRKAR
jgi:uncharacterized membrane protein YgdD (TMEM256/DUF423 family)